MTNSPLPPPPPPSAAGGTGTVRQQLPRAGQSTVGWRTALGAVWVASILAMAAVWQASEQLGQSTWWLGPRGDPQPIFIRLLPFYGSVVVLLAAINNLRLLPLWSILAAAPIVVLGIVDRGRFTPIGNLELAIGAVMVLVSLVSVAGMYFRRPVPTNASTERG